eukprot:COSAG06_NODE_13743_length_1224_cov_1.258667_1_plen_27_part_10
MLDIGVERTGRGDGSVWVRECGSAGGR